MVEQSIEPSIVEKTLADGIPSIKAVHCVCENLKGIMRCFEKVGQRQSFTPQVINAPLKA